MSVIRPPQPPSEQEVIVVTGSTHEGATHLFELRMTHIANEGERTAVFLCQLGIEHGNGEVALHTRPLRCEIKPGGKNVLAVTMAAFDQFKDLLERE